MKLKIETQSPLLAASGEGSGLVDADSVFHDSGFPYIPSRRIKGRLKTSALEVLEMVTGRENNEQNVLIQQLFGEKGHHTGNASIKIPNLYLQQWREMLDELENLKKVSNEYKLALNPAFIRQYYSQEIAQTAVAENGTARENSLRNYRTINKGLPFETTLENTSNLTEPEKALLFLAALNLRSIGTRRNRGFGKVACYLEIEDMDADEAVNILKENAKETLDSEKQSTYPANLPEVNLSGERCSMEVIIRLTAPVLLAKEGGEQNTVNTEHFISGSRIRGAIAKKLIKVGGLGQEAHCNHLFRQTVLDGNVIIDHAWPVFENHTSQPIPLHFQKPKGKENLPGSINIFQQNSDNTKPVAGLGYKSGKHYCKDEPETSFMFHHSRTNRVGARSEDGNIFYYESLSTGQIFKGKITGDKEVLKALKDTLGNQVNVAFGRSRSAQYADAEMEMKGPQNIQSPDIKKDEDNNYALTCLSSLILYNEYGLAESTVSNLKEYLEEETGYTVSIKNAAVSYNQHEHYVGVWQSKTQRFSAFKEGSSFLVQFEEADNNLTEKLNNLKLKGLGEMRSWGYGNIDISPTEAQGGTVNIMRPEPRSDNSSIIEPNLLKGIVSTYKQQQQKVDTRINGMRDANLFSSNSNDYLNNHLISRMLELIEKANNPAQLKQLLEDIKGKPAGDALQKAADLYNDLLQKPYNLEQIDSEDFKSYQLYWKSFFNTLRKINKENERKQNNKAESNG